MSGGLGRYLATGGAGLVALVILVAGATAGALGADVGGLGANEPPSADALGAIPPAYLALYQQAASTCPGLPWSVLAAIGTIESGNGANDGPSSAGAVGPMQFELGTFAQYDQPVPPGGANPPSPYDPTDAIYAAARDLCANGASNGSDLPGAVFAYNHAWWYVTEVLSLAGRLAQEPTIGAPSPAALVAVDYAVSQLGTPYRWARWSTPLIPGPTCGSNCFRSLSGRPGDPMCTSERPGPNEQCPTWPPVERSLWASGSETHILCSWPCLGTVSKTSSTSHHESLSSR